MIEGRRSVVEINYPLSRVPKEQFHKIEVTAVHAKAARTRVNGTGASNTLLWGTILSALQAMQKAHIGVQVGISSRRHMY
jgi:hypothetical protein